MKNYVCLAVLLFLMCGGSCSAAGKKLIDFGHDSPTPAFARANYLEMDKTPFDGTCFKLGRGADRPHAGKPWDNLSWGAWGHRYFKMEDLQHHVDDLKAAKFKKLVNNFIIMTVVPGDVDWFDDFGPVVSNYRLAARIARQVPHCNGILLDTEVYGAEKYSTLWDYDGYFARQRYTDTYTYDEYAAQARQRGREIMAAMQEEYPGLTVFVTHSYTLAWLNWARDPSRVREPGWVYTLLTPFLDGLHDKAGQGVKIVDGRETAYRYRTRGEFQQAYREGSEDILAMVGNPEAYKRVKSLGFGLYMEALAPNATTWEPNQPSTHYFTPAEWEQSLRYALEISDEYVWAYTEKSGWWGSWRESMPQGFYDATVRARQAG